VTIFGRVGKAVHGARRRNAPPWTILREFNESLNLIEDFDQIAMNLLGTIREAAKVERLVFFVDDADLA